MFCLRRWPLSHPDRERLDWINLVLVHAFSHDCPFVATPIESKSGKRYVESSGFYWELAPWMPGSATFDEDPNDQRLEMVMSCLAKFHLASAQINLGFQESKNSAARFLALQNASQVIEEIRTVYADQQPECVDQLRRIVLRKGVGHASQLAGAIEPVTREPFPVQPVIRDVWHDHLLFTGNELTGIVDFGAMQIDNVALDLSRVLGSLVSGQPARWQTAIEVYSSIRPLSPREIDFVFILDRSTAFLGGLNWLKWILLEGRRFESVDHVEKRIRHLIERLVE
jgi:Ser/Thr protein kinase RdoA (MazF antagonist)